MKKIALGAALLLASSTAFAQTSVNSSTEIKSKASPSSNMMLRKDSGAESTGSTRAGIQTNVRTDGGARVGIEARERTGVSVHSRTVREVSEPSVSVTRRHVVSSYEEPDTVVRHTVVKKKKPSKKIVLKKKYPSTKVVVKKRRYHVVEEPVEVRRRTTVHRYETSEPGVSVRRSTTFRQTHESSPSVGVSIEQRRGANVSTTGTVSSGSRATIGGSSGGNSSATIRSNSGGSNTMLKKQGSSSSGSSSNQ